MDETQHIGTDETAVSGAAQCSTNPGGWTDERITAVKREINCLVFEWGNEQMTLREAEEVACEMLTAIMKKRRGRDSQNELITR